MKITFFEEKYGNTLTKINVILLQDVEKLKTLKALILIRCSLTKYGKTCMCH